jgi:hypothetical protein
MQVVWSSPGTSAPFATLTAAGMTIDLHSANLASAVIRIGPESIDMTTLPASPQIIPTAPPALVTTNTNSPGSIPVTLPPVFLPAYTYGNPLAVSPAPGVIMASTFSTFATGVSGALPTTPALAFDARGTYDRATNTFTAVSVNAVL